MLFRSGLDLSENGLSGALPETFGDLSQLRKMDISHNRLSGAVPDAWLGMTRLLNGELDLGYNRLSVPAGYPVVGNALHQFLVLKDPDWHLTQAKRLFLPGVLR